MNNESIIIFCMFCQCYCWTLYPERGRKLCMFVPPTYHALADCWTLYPERGRKRDPQPALHRLLVQIVGLFAPRGDGNTLEVFQLERSPNCWTLHPPREGTETGWLSDIKVPEENVLLDSSPRNGPGFPPQPHPVIFTLRQTAAALR